MATKLRKLTIKFNSYEKQNQYLMSQYFHKMSSMIRELESVSHNITDEQLVQTIMHSLTNSWEHIKINMTHNEYNKIFNA